MQIRSADGRSKLVPITNSDIVFMDYFPPYKMHDLVYTQQVQQLFFWEKQRTQSRIKFEANQCRECCIKTEGENSKSLSSLLPWGTPANEDESTDCLKFCHYCMDVVTC